MWGREIDGEVVVGGVGGVGGGGDCELWFRPERAKNTGLYAVVFIKHDEWSHYINTMEADGREKVEDWAAKTGRAGEKGGMEQIPVDGTLSALWNISAEQLTELNGRQQKQNEKKTDDV